MTNIQFFIINKIFADIVKICFEIKNNQYDHALADQNPFPNPGGQGIRKNDINPSFES